ncbi:MAG: GGDEF domain-containing protein [Sphingobium sp.]|uniref:GGDEF domain-containing protein n=1 Tax=Sphingobium sp. TaxID=1912891 RepID=UPI0029B67C6E|nr:GGDEF domain-containing protein [Sphingobium sp.]MDX3911155.1 GGDEF domain-containing protein [Sphingobium sp.]
MSNSDNTSGSLLGWLGFRGARHPAGANGQSPSASETHSPFWQARRELLDEIASFLLTHGLDVTANNLLAAHEVACGANPALARQIARRLAEGEAITQQWLDEATAAHDGEDKHDGIEQLMTRLESTLESFSKNTSAARSATSDYSDELAQHVAELDQVQQTGSIISSLADLAKAMLERTRRLETDMRRSEDEAKGLRRSLEKAKRDAEVDHLTGLLNRRSFEAVLDREFHEARAQLDPLVVAFCDIDHFKQINDNHGHEAGDRVIRAIADMLAGVSDDNCHVARHGGEEFVMLFRGATLTEAKKRLDDVREQMAERRLVNRKTDEAFGRITFSAGIADVFDHSDPRAALRAADEALYAAKEAGRNQICIAPRAEASA